MDCLGLQLVYRLFIIVTHQTLEYANFRRFPNIRKYPKIKVAAAGIT